MVRRLASNEARRPMLFCAISAGTLAANFPRLGHWLRTWTREIEPPRLQKGTFLKR